MYPTYAQPKYYPNLLAPGATGPNPLPTYPTFGFGGRTGPLAGPGYRTTTIPTYGGGASVNDPTLAAGASSSGTGNSGPSPPWGNGMPSLDEQRQLMAGFPYGRIPSRYRGWGGVVDWAKLWMEQQNQSQPGVPKYYIH